MICFEGVVVVQSPTVSRNMRRKYIHFMTTLLQSPEASGETSPGEPAPVKDDDDGFKDTSRGPRRSRTLKSGRKGEADFSDRPNGILKPSSRSALSLTFKASATVRMTCLC